MHLTHFSFLTDGLPGEMGTLIQLGDLEADMAGIKGYYRRDGSEVRALAASRHLDYVVVLAYEPGDNTVEALFLDVRNGYPYGSIEVVREGRGVRNFWGGPVRKPQRLNRATYRLAKSLKPELDQMVEGLLVTQ